MIRGRRISKTQEKILLLLLSGVALGCTRSPRVAWRIIANVSSEWQHINARALNNGAHALFRSRLVSAKPHKDGTMTLTLTAEGKKYALRYNLNTMTIPRPGTWDGVWRMVMYDIPETIRELRFDLARTLKRLGFYELQQSVFVHPYDCAREIDFLIELYEARQYVRFAEVTNLDDDTPLRQHFKLPPLTKSV